MGISFSQPLALLLFVFVGYFVYLWKISPKAFTTQQRKWFLGVRIVLVSLLILSLAGLQSNFRHSQKSVVYVADRSASLQEKTQEISEWIRKSLASLPATMGAGVVSLGKKPMVEYPVATHLDFKGLQGVLDPNYTDLATGLRLASSLMPEELGKQIILLTDGKQNRGNALEQAKLLSQQGNRIDVLPIASASGPEVLVETVDLPSRLHEGELFDLKATLASKLSTSGTVRIMADNKVLREEEIEISKGTSQLVWGLNAEKAGLHTYKVEVISAKDTRPENNVGQAITQVEGVPRILIVEGTPGDSKALGTALTSINLQVKTVEPGYMPKTLTGLAQYSAVVLVNVPATDLQDATMQALENFVSDLGRGLVMVGGENSYGPGGYYQTPVEKALPVNMEITGKAELPSVGLNLIIDKSGSMCHTQNNVTKMDMAKEAALRATEILDTKDQLGVIVFDSEYKWVVKTAPLLNKQWVQEQISSIEPSGGTNMYPSLEAAYKALKEAKVKVKHIILLSDGVSKYGGDYESLLKQMEADNITLSVVAVGSDSDTSLLKYLAQQGHGRYYFTDQIDNIPKIFAKETMMVTRSYFVQEPFTPVITGSANMLPATVGLPQLLGYVATTPKDTAEVILTSQEGDPVLARWHYGLGRTVAWTSDTKGRWAEPWLNWSAFPQFWGKVISWTLPEENGNGLNVTTTHEGGLGHIRVDIPVESQKAADLQAKVIAPDGTSADLIIPAVSPGQYQVDFPMEQPGAYMIQVVEKEGDKVVQQQTAGLVQSYSPEFLLQADQHEFIEQLAAAGGGQVLDPAQFDGVGKLKVPEATGKIPLWPKLLTFAVLLLPIDIASRRFNWNLKWASALRQRLGLLRQASNERVEHGQESLLQSIKERKLNREQLYQTRGEIESEEQRSDEGNEQESSNKASGTQGRRRKAEGSEDRGAVALMSTETKGKVSNRDNGRIDSQVKVAEENHEGGFSARLLAAKKRVAAKEDKKK
ncbi:MAG: VWA domain-containing protein [Desulfosporosinus sp.]|nr:VWA domain-containing protein [Desulfosporosinus sp.]